jgi:hypothetical protein
MKVHGTCPAGTELLYAERQTDRQAGRRAKGRIDIDYKVIIRLSKFC